MIEMQERVIQIEEPNEEFSKAIAKAGGENLHFCFQCGTCTASCPVFKSEENYSPRLIMRLTALGLINRVLYSNLIWLCATCYSCTERCPRGIRPTEVIRAIRNMAAEKGYAHKFYKEQATAIINYGRIWEDEEIVNTFREDMELPPISSVDTTEISKILDGTKVKELLAAKKGGGNE